MNKYNKIESQSADVRLYQYLSFTLVLQHTIIVSNPASIPSESLNSLAISGEQFIVHHAFDIILKSF